MSQHTETIASLIGARICHDLINPIGAVTNGLELLALAGVPDGPELALVSDSAASAAARIRLFRLAFGPAAQGQSCRADEIVSIWQDVYSDRRFDLLWSGPPTLERQEARLVLLGCLCLETAMPQGGQMIVTCPDAGWQIAASGPRITVDPEIWDHLEGDERLADLRPAHVQFALLPLYAAHLGRRASHARHEDGLTIRA